MPGAGFEPASSCEPAAFKAACLCQLGHPGEPDAPILRAAGRGASSDAQRLKLLRFFWKTANAGRVLPSGLMRPPSNSDASQSSAGDQL